MKNIWKSKEVKVFKLEDLPLGENKPHAQYHLISNDSLFKIILFQQLFAKQNSRFHSHPAREILILLAGESFAIETRRTLHFLPPGSIAYIPPDVIHRVVNYSCQNSLAVILIEKNWKEEDVIYFTRKGKKWMKIK